MLVNSEQSTVNIMNILFYIFLFSIWKNNVFGDCGMNTTVEETMKLLEKGDKEIRFSNETKKFVLVMGRTGIGKTPFTKWLTVNNSQLISYQKTLFDQFLMKDTDGTIGDSITQSATLFPDLYMFNGTAYYDFPGFRDTRCLFFSLATIYSIKRVVDYAEGVKILILIDYESVKMGGVREFFQNLLDDINGFIKDISKFKDSFALVVTKVPVFMNSVKPTDTQYIFTLGQTLLQIRNELAQSENTESVMKREKAIFIIDTIIANNFSKIGLFRFTDRPGPYSEIPILREGKIRIEDIVSRELTFTNSTGEDFYIPVHNELKGDIQRLLDVIVKKSFTPEISKILDDIRSFYAEQMQRIKCISQLNDLVSRGIDTLNKITTFELIPFVNELLNAVDVLQISTVSKELLNNVTTHINHVTFLRDCDIKRLDVPAQLVINMENITELIKTDFKKHIEILTKKSLSSINEGVNYINNKLMEYHELYENKTFDINELYGGMSRYYESLTDIKFEGLQSFSSQIRKLFDMTQSNLEFNVVLNEYGDDKSFNELKLLNPTETKFDRKEILKDFACIKEFGDSSMWYNFLKNLYSHLDSHFESIDTEKLLTQSTNPMDTPRKANEITELLGLVKSINMDRKLYENIKEVTINSRKMKSLESVVKQIQNFDVSCVGDTLTASGYIIKISRVQATKCWTTAKNIEIFSFYKLHMDNDIDLSGRGVKLSIIAPSWKIFGNRRIDLNGADATAQKVDGDPGLPGGSGGQFFGVGSTFFGSQNLIISSCGGNGGPGQNGRKGSDGVEGVDPTFSYWIGWNNEDEVRTHYSEFTVESRPLEHYPFTTYIYKIYRPLSPKPTNGSDGGVGGIGGLTGDIRIITFNQKDEIKYDQMNGTKGADGAGGFGGQAKSEGHILNVAFMVYNSIFDRKKLSHSKTAQERQFNGYNGNSGANSKSQHKPIKGESISYSLVLSNYQKHLQEKLIDYVIINTVREFQRNLNENTEIVAISDSELPTS